MPPPPPACYNATSFNQPLNNWNVSDPQYEFGTLGGDDMGKAFA